MNKATTTYMGSSFYLGCMRGTTSRKRCEKEPQSFSHCGSFDHHELQFTKRLKVFLFCFTTLILNLLGACNTPLGKYFQDISTIILKAPKFLKFELLNQKTNLQLFNECRSGWSKESQWTNDYGSFLPCFLLVCILVIKLWLTNIILS